MAFTYFFRDSHTLDKLTDKFIKYVSGKPQVKIWNAGCAMGPETYTFAIILAEKMSYFAFKNVNIDATDLDPENEFVHTLKEAVYPEPELARVPPDIMKKYFEANSKEGYFKVIDHIISRVQFTQHDLLTLKPISNNYHLVICKNVLLHFHPLERIKVIEMFHSVLEPGGMFTTEQTQKLPEECKHLFRPLATDANIYEKIG